MAEEKNKKDEHKHHHYRHHFKKKPRKRGFSMIDYVGIAFVAILIALLLGILLFNINIGI